LFFRKKKSLPLAYKDCIDVAQDKDKENLNRGYSCGEDLDTDLRNIKVGKGRSSVVECLFSKYEDLVQSTLLPSTDKI
jgi:hypothetical protein